MRGPVNETMARLLVHVFDLGNVLIFVHEEVFLEKLRAKSRPGGRAVELFWEHFDGSRADRGGDFNSIHPVLVREADLKMTLEEFRLAWNDMFTPNPPMIELVSEVRGPRVLLSNTNEPHVAWFHEEYPHILALFDHCVFSNEVGVRKPELGIYRHVESLTGHQPEDHVFVDDRQDNVEGAVAAGWHGIQFRGVEDCRERLGELERG